MSDSPNGILPDSLEKRFVKKMHWVTRLLMKTKITPNLITLSTLPLGLLAGIALALNHMAVGWIFIVLMGLFDILDGQLATSANLASPFGAVLDSTIDRYSEAFVLIGLGFYFYRLDQPLWMLVVSLVL
ncbi:MAG: CDP-alcohol phosphatidyltransferase family protein, partial [Calditrichaeota bacterium]|nr:CDP-alcohol phosphatidyltransferase family protein [Calditrichota bacterium]